MSGVIYSVYLVDQRGDVCEYDAGSSPRAAMREALAAARDYPSLRVYVRWRRSSDGQVGYLDPDGNRVAEVCNWRDVAEAR